MTTCRDCIHYDVCEDNLKYIQERFLKGLTFGKSEFTDGEFCNLFKDKSRIIELPFKVGDTVYTIENNSVKKWYVDSINNIVEYWKRELKSNKNKYKYDFRFAKFDDFGKTVFLTKEEAEAKLKELNEK